MLHINWGAGFPRALQCIMPSPPPMIVCSGVLCMNFAKEVKWIQTIHYICNNCGIFSYGYEKTFAHRIGEPRNDDGADSRPAIAKSIYRPELFCVFQRKRDLKNGVKMSEDLIWENRQKKKKLKAVMRRTYDEGKKARFRRGNWWIINFFSLQCCYYKVVAQLGFLFVLDLING